MSQKPSYIYVVFDAENFVVGAFSTEARAKAYVADTDPTMVMRALMIDELPRIHTSVYPMGV